MTLDKNKIEKFKALLLQEKTELENNLERIAKSVDKRSGDYETVFEEIGHNKEDNATEVEQYSDNLSVEVALEKKLQAAIQALERIEKGTYGFCQRCQKEIPEERLEANPSANNCLGCN
jgi:DnaK suppressor protein